jgi:hypothetical protein
MKNILSSVLLIFCVLLISCGGGGGNGSTSSSTIPSLPPSPPPNNPNIVTIGTVSFDITTSTNFSGNDFYYNLTTQNWNVAIPIGSTADAETTPYTATTIAIPEQASLPCVIIQNGTPSGTDCIYAAVSVDGALYTVTAPASNTSSPVVLSQPIMIIPNNTDLSVGYTYSSGIAPTDGGIINYNAAYPYQLTVISTSATSPQGFVDCLHIRLTNTDTSAFQYTTIDVWYQAGEGAVDETMTPGTVGPPVAPTVEEYRSGIAFPG